MTINKIYYKRKLPHYQPHGHTFFVTFRLYGSLPVATIKKLKEEREKELKVVAGYANIKIRKEKYKNYQSQYFGKFDKLLGGSTFGPKWLQDEKIAQVVKEAIHFRDEKKYELIVYTIMPNHVHLVFTPIVGRTGCSTYIVTDILKSLKWNTALRCNKLLKRSGAFWQHESYDHVVRDPNELNRITEYVLNNPVKAGLCEKWEDWQWSYCNFNLMG